MGHTDAWISLAFILLVSIRLLQIRVSWPILYLPCHSLALMSSAQRASELNIATRCLKVCTSSAFLAPDRYWYRCRVVGNFHYYVFLTFTRIQCHLQLSSLDWSVHEAQPQNLRSIQGHPHAVGWLRECVRFWIRPYILLALIAWEPPPINLSCAVDIHGA